MLGGIALVIENPVAGKVRGRKNMNTLLAETLSENLFTYKVCVTGKQGDAIDYIKRYADDVDLVVCCGGDGTLNEVVTGLMREAKTVPIFYIPMGTTNDMARTLNLPQSWMDALALLKSGTTNYHDAGLLNGQTFFTYSASFGAFSDVSYNTPQSAKNRLGYAAYWLYGVRSFRRNLLKSKHLIKPYQAVVSTDKQLYEGRFVFGCVSNSTSVGGVIKLNSADVDLCDGQMELLLIRTPEKPGELTYTVSKLSQGDYTDERIVLTHANHISFSFDEDVDWSADGEYAGSHRQAKIEVKHKAFRILSNI